MLCRICGHANPSGAMVCEVCDHPIDPGIPEAMFCPQCGALNGQGQVACSVCGRNLKVVIAVPAVNRTAICPYCQTANPRHYVGSTSFCIRCGREIFANMGVIGIDGDDYVPATPPVPKRNACPICGVAADSVMATYQMPDSPLATALHPPPSRLWYLLIPHRDPDPEDANLLLQTSDNPDVMDLSVDAIRTLSPVFLPAIELWDYINALAERAIVGIERTEAEYELLVELWKSAYYCVHDQVVFIRDGAQCRSWSVEDFGRLLGSLER